MRPFNEMKGMKETKEMKRIKGIENDEAGDQLRLMSVKKGEIQ